MSLTSIIRSPDVRKRLSSEFIKPPFILKKPILAPPMTKNYGLVGTAFDYLLRFRIERINKKVVQSSWVAENVVKQVADDERLTKKFAPVVAEAKVLQDDFLKTGKFTLEMYKTVILLAKVDYFLREQYVDPAFGKVDKRDVTDLKRLVSIIPLNSFKAKKIVALNPTFGNASNLFGGADADLVIDDTIIDIKTTKELETRRDAFNQLIGYYALSKIASIDGLPRSHKIRTLAIYFSRFAEFAFYSVDSIIEPKRFKSFLKWFEQRAANSDLYDYR